MASAKRDYESFLQWLHAEGRGAPADARRLANLIYANFDQVARTSTQRSQRSQFLILRSRNDLAGTPEGMPAIAVQGADAEWSWTSLKKLTVGPFRGFRRPEPFDLAKRVVLFYGPNGSGKSSLCEALEFALVGAIDEAAVKRFDDPRLYFRNVHEDKAAVPELIAVGADGKDVKLAADKDANRFLFVEKNRIDNFSRIAAKPPGERAALIATLFGADRFNDFVGDFNENQAFADLLTLSSVKQMRLATLRVALKKDRDAVEAEAASFAALAGEEAGIAEAYQPGLSYAALLALIGTPEAPGRLADLNGWIDVAPAPLAGVDRDGLVAKLTEADAAKAEVDRLVADLARRGDDVSFSDLFNAVLALRAASPDKCPACETPLEGEPHAHVDPYEKAERGLEGLRDLAQTQALLAQARRRREAASRALAADFRKLAVFVGPAGEGSPAVETHLTGLRMDEAADWWLDYAKREAGAPTIEDILGVADRAGRGDQASREATRARDGHIAERDRIVAANARVAAMNQKRALLAQSLAEARGRIANFEKAHADLIKEAAAEPAQIERDTRIRNAYVSFIAHIRRYRDGLPAALMAGLNDMAMELYNGFNAKDRAEDKLAALHLPMTATGRIEISTVANPRKRLDALHVLSEGHIRCLGLAILLAKALIVKAPAVIFDDAINAIDHDHRRGIRETIFKKDGRFAGTQIIVTCHSNEFIKDIQNDMPKPPEEHCRTYGFAPHQGDFHPKVLGNLTSRNYLEKARRAKDEMNDRDALHESRRALELAVDRIWTWMNQCELGRVKVMMTKADGRPELRASCEALRSKLAKANTFDHPEKEQVIAQLGVLLDIGDENHRIWDSLNGGTHEERDRDDFDADLVERVVAALEAIDALKLRRVAERA